ncbi:hypothetical protein ACS0TY_010795 [Phlomoides rotata]
MTRRNANWTQIVSNHIFHALRRQTRQSCFSINCVGQSGGIYFFWKDSSTCNVVSYSNNHIDIIINNTGLEWRIASYYGVPNRNLRSISWNLLRTLASANSFPWICIGDFNDLLSPEDKRGRAEHPNVIMDYNLNDLPHIGYQYTWSRCKGTLNAVEESLDRAMVNLTWNDLFPNAKLLNLGTSIRSQSYFVIRNNRPFHFENKWLEELELRSIIDRCWSGFGDLNILDRLDATVDTLSLWGKQIALALKKRIGKAYSDLRDLTNARSGQLLIEARAALAQLLIIEKSHWCQRGKAANWHFAYGRLTLCSRGRRRIGFFGFG